MDKWHSIADQKIREAMEEGAFRNLRGQGRPLKLERNPFEPPELHMAHAVLEAAGMSPAWMQERKDLDACVDRAIERLRLAARGPRWDAAAEDFRRTAAELNRRILTYNLSVPSGGFQRMQVDAEFEIRRLMKPASGP
ncbi:MAG TPA: DUF1992 domain-containing protein [Chloroflexota bacterium]|nr:DUF1992 domain-containing protein [Chloroflexota bacterium]